MPDAFAEYLLGARRYLLKRYPFEVVYRELSESTEVVAVSHANRRPGYWKSRIN